MKKERKSLSDSKREGSRASEALAALSYHETTNT